MRHNYNPALWIIPAALLAGCSTQDDGDETEESETVNAAEDDDDAEGDDDAELPEFCSSASAGSGSVPDPIAEDGPSFTTELVSCTLSIEEATVCYGGESNAQVEVAGDERIITGNALPGHEMGLFPNPGNPNIPSPQDVEYRVAAEPERGDTPRSGRTVGVGINAVKIEPETAEVFGDTSWRYEALTFGGRLAEDPNDRNTDTLGVDCNFAHTQPTGEYHYHGVATSLLPSEPEITLVAWAADGYPILGRFGYSDPEDSSSDIVALKGSFRVKEGEREPLQGGEDTPPGDYDGTFVQDWEFDASVGDLDECNGRAETMEIDGQSFDYVYYMTFTYPFTPRCVWGEVIDNGFAFGGGGGGGGGGAGAGGGEVDGMTVPQCEEADQTMCCGDDTCGGPETAENCPEDCQ